jgi:hypothetical protein
MVAAIRAEPDEALQQSLFRSLLALMSNEEHLAMLENLLESDELQLDTALVRRARRNGRVEGQIEARRDDILTIIETRFAPIELVHGEIEHRLNQVDDLEQLAQLFTLALRADNAEAFMTAISRNQES